MTKRNPGMLYGLGNLVENAIDFASSKVEVEARWSKDEVRIVIADDGAGFPPHVLEQLGEPFVTTRRAPARGRRRRGAYRHGLGFFIAKTLLERSGADSSSPTGRCPRGRVVTVAWPRARFEHAARKRRNGPSR